MPKGTPKWQSILDRFESACKEHCWVGGMHPSLHHYVEKEYQDAKIEIINFMKEKEVIKADQKK